MVLPANHPVVKPARTGVLLLNLGTPDGTDYWSMRRYLSEFLSDQRVIQSPKWLWQPLLQGIILTTRPSKSGHAYAQIWNKDKNESPLRTYMRSQCEKIARLFDGQGIVFDWAMRYGNPSVAEGIKNLTDQGCRRILLFALYPQYSACTTATAYDKAFDHLKTLHWQPAIRTAQDWHADPVYIDVLADSVKNHLQSIENKPEHIVASFHGLPKKYLLQGDPYSCFCQKTARLLREKLDWPAQDWSTTFQSRFGPTEWVKPYTDETVAALAAKGVKHLAILSPAFVSDCVETLEEINIGLRETFLSAGGERFTYIPCLNDSDAHVAFLAGRIRAELGGWI